MVGIIPTGMVPVGGCNVDTVTSKRVDTMSDTIRTKIALYYDLADKASDNGNKVLAHKMVRRAERLIDRMYD